MATCPSCGAEAKKAGQRRCMSCGSPMEIEREPAQTEQKVHASPSPPPPESPGERNPPRAAQSELYALFVKLQASTKKYLGVLGSLKSETEGSRQSAAAQRDQELAAAEKQRKVAETRAGDAAAITSREAVATATRAALAMAGDSVASPRGFAIEPELAERGLAARFIRLGDVTRRPGGGVSETLTVPFVLPVLDQGNLAIEAEAKDTDRAHDLALTALYRMFEGTSPGQLLLYVFDPTLSGCWTPFGGLGAPGSDMAPVKAVEATAVTSMLADLTTTLSDTSQILRGESATLGEFLAKSEGEELRPYRTLLILDYPRGFDQRTNDALLRLAERGPKLGLSMIVHRNRREEAANGVNPDKLLELCERISLGDHVVWGSAKSLDIELDSPPFTEAISSLCTAIEAAARTSSRPTIDLAALLADGSGTWKKSSAKNVQVVVGKRGSIPVGFTLGDQGDNWHNVLVGGSVGSGKSNLLLALIYSLASQYSPEELVMYLLDFKEGVEFARFADPVSFLPHARVVGIEADPDLGRGVLEALTGEFESRSTLFKEAGVPGLNAYRDATGIVLPRLLLIVDEFQVLLDGEHPSGRQNVELLNNLVRKGRSYGIHVILSSQTLSGIESLAMKRDSIFGQFPVRIALKTNAHQSEVILTQGNTAAAGLRYRVESILNTESGRQDANIQFMVAHASDESLATLDQEFSRLKGAVAPPRAIRAGVPADPIPDLLAATRKGERKQPRAIFGESLRPGSPPCSADFEPGPGSHVVIAGNGVQEAIGMLQMATASLALSAPSGSQFLFVDAAQPSTSEAFGAQSLLEMVIRCGHKGRIVSEIQDADLPEEGMSQLTFVIGCGLDNLDLARAALGGDPTNAMQRIIQRGNRAGIHLLGWWQAPRYLAEHLGSDWTKSVGTRIVLKVDPKSAQTITERVLLAEWVLPPARAAFVDAATEGATTQFIPYRTLSDDRLQRIQR